MALIEDFENIAKDYLSPKSESSTEDNPSEHKEITPSDSENEVIVVVSDEEFEPSMLIQSNIVEALIPGKDKIIDIDSGQDDLDGIICEPPVEELPLDGDIDQENFIDNGDIDDIISSDNGDIIYDW